MFPVANDGGSNAVAVAESEFTFEAQVQEHDGVAWELNGTLELLTRDQAAEYNAFIKALGGRKGTFLFSPTGFGTARGVATGTPLVNGIGQTGQTLITDGWTPSQTNILKNDDYFQLGSGDTATLHSVVNGDVNSDVGGNTTFDFAPKIVTAPADNAAITILDPVGKFRMRENLLPVEIKPPFQHTIRFSARTAQ